MTSSSDLGFTRRSMLAAGVGSIAAVGAPPLRAQQIDKPNILWIVSEDNNPFIGAYGDKLANTPNLDTLAKRGILYRNAYSNAPVCAPSRFAILTGIHPESCGPAHHMRGNAKWPDFLRTFPEYMRSAGYFCTNNFKTDYNCDVDPARIWDANGPKAHFRDRPSGKPFMSMFTTLTSHESKVFGPTEGRVKPEQIELPPYLPDTPNMRSDFASYYNLIEQMDGEVGQRLAELEADGLSEDTIVFYFSDNGGVLPRSKRFCYDEGLRCALMIYLPPKWAHLAPAKAGSVIDAPVSFIDLAPTLLSLAGIEKPASMQGSALLGGKLAAPKKYAFGMRNRMDMRYDFVRTVTDGRYRYIRNYMPHRPWGQVHGFLMLMRSYQDLYRLHAQGQLNPTQERFFQTKPFEEFYDLSTDPHEIDNRIDDRQHAQRIAQMRKAVDAQMLRVNDNGFIPEGGEVEGYVESRAARAYPLKRIMALASAAARKDTRKISLLIKCLSDPHETMRYWAATGLLILGAQAAPAASKLLDIMRNDTSRQVRIVAAEALASLGHAQEAIALLASYLHMPEDRPVRDEQGGHAGHAGAIPQRARENAVRLQAINALTYVPDAKPALQTIKTLAERGRGELQHCAKYLVMKIEGTYDPSIPLLDMRQTPSEFLQGGRG